jgi:hypothetical protein
MREIELWTEDGHFVAVVDIPPFPDHAMPVVVMWGSRVFHLDPTPEGSSHVRYKECFAVYSLTPSPGRSRTEAPACRACGKPLLPENVRIADGCPCNSARGVNHGLVAKDTCTCTVCDPEQTGSTRYPSLERARARAAMLEIEADARDENEKPRSGGLREREVPPVDRSARCTVGEALAPGVPNTEDRGDGQQKGYVILCKEERAKGFVRPVRNTYRHAKCGSTTTMGQALAETYARSPDFYSGTYCCTCRGHYPVGADGEFVWDGTDEKVGT